MFCPKCATQNIDGARFCRSCGADISLVPQAMTGDITASLAKETDEDLGHRRGSRRNKEASFEKGIRGIFSGLGFLFVAIALSFSVVGRWWWYWMLIPAFSMLGGGVAEYMRARRSHNMMSDTSVAKMSTFPGSTQVRELQQHSTSELVPPPPSVTEGTTRHLGAESPTKVFASADSAKKES